MGHLVLAIGYSPQEYDVEKAYWHKYGISFDFVDDVNLAVRKLLETEYVCITIRADNISQGNIDALRLVRDVPILVLSPAASIEQRYTCVHFSAMQYIHAAGRPSINLDTENSLRHYLDIPTGERKPLTIITVKDLCFCLEHRSVEISGQEIDLTEKEFDILALLIMNQRQVFTYEMIMDAIWQNDYAYYSRNALSTHISNLRRKLKVTPDVPNYIISIRGVGYKFEAQQ